MDSGQSIDQLREKMCLIELIESSVDIDDLMDVDYQRYFAGDERASSYPVRVLLRHNRRQCKPRCQVLRHVWHHHYDSIHVHFSVHATFVGICDPPKVASHEHDRIGRRTVQANRNGLHLDRSRPSSGWVGIHHLVGTATCSLHPKLASSGPKRC